MTQSTFRMASAAAAFVLAAAIVASASGAVGIVGIVEKVVLEPSDRAPERAQIWGAFAYAEGAGTGIGAYSKAERGYLYVQLPDVATGMADERLIGIIRTEWNDLKAVAGKDQPVAFGRWGYIAGFPSLQPDAKPVPPSTILARAPRGGATTDLRVRPASETPAGPGVYETNSGVVKLTEASHADLIKALRDALKR